MNRTRTFIPTISAFCVLYYGEWLKTETPTFF